MAVELLSSAVPVETGPALVALSYVAPEECRVVGGEVSVAVIYVTVQDSVEVDKIILVSLVRELA